MGLIRMHFKGAIHFVTNRCEHEMFFLKPTATANHLIRFWLAKAKDKYGDGIEIYAFIFMTNHFHILLQDTKGQLADFMGYFQANLARSLNVVHNRRGSFWFREYDDLIVEGEEEFWNRYNYVVGNPVKAGLVAKPEHWGGVTSFPFAMENRPITVTGVNKSEYNEAKRYKKNVNKKDFEETYIFKLTHPPQWKHWAQCKRATAIKEMTRCACKEYHKKRLYKPVLGMRKVMRVHHSDSPDNPSRKPRFKFFCLCNGRLKELKDAYKAFVAYYRKCLNALYNASRRKQLGRAAQIEWPEGSYPPTQHQPIG